MKYSEMATGITKVASALRKRGLKTGDFALVMASNFVELPVAMLGIMKAGGSCASLTLNLFVGNSSLDLFINSRIDDLTEAI